MNQRTDFRRAFLTTETITSLILIGIILALLAGAISQFNDHFDLLTRRAAAWRAAEAAMERFRAGHAYDETGFAADFPDMSMNVSRGDAEGDWRGLADVTITVRTTSRRGHAIEARLQGYVPPQETAR